MNQDKFQNGFQVYKPCLEAISHYKRGSGRHSLNDYKDVATELER